MLYAFVFKLSVRRLRDIKSPDFSSPRRAKACFLMAKKIIITKSKEIKTLKQTIRRLKKNIITLKGLVQHLHQKNLISENAQNKLMVNNIFFIIYLFFSDLKLQRYLDLQ